MRKYSHIFKRHILEYVGTSLRLFQQKEDFFKKKNKSSIEEMWQSVGNCSVVIGVLMGQRIVMGP